MGYEAELRPVWDRLLELYERFDAFCKERHLRYYVTGGTLLGAVRHDGFIPWDDDFDVVMPRPDYIRMLELEAHPQDAFFSQAGTTEKPLLFVKLLDEKVPCTWIDIIPIDGMPKADILFGYWMLKRMAWRHYGESLGWKILNLIFWGGRHDSCEFQRWLASFEYDSSPCVEDFNGNGRRFKLRRLNAASFGEPVWHKFDRVEVPMPREWDKFLRNIFGDDYMTPPSLEKRVPSHVKER